MRAMVVTERQPDPVAAVRRALERGADEVIVVGAANGALDAPSLVALRALKHVRLRVSVATFDETTHARLIGVSDPGTIVRGIARAGALSLPVDVVLPIATGLGSAAGRLHGLARATPKVTKYLLSRLPDDLMPLEPTDIAAEVEAAMRTARQLGLPVEEDSDARVDTELHAVLAGIKPAMRVSSGDGDEHEVRRRYEQYGLATCAGSATVLDDAGRPQTFRVIYIATSLTLAEDARAAEATALASKDLEPRAASFRNLGHALGYPPCCVDAYVARVVRPAAARIEPWAEEYCAASGAFDDSPAWQLNHFLLERGALATFMPCSYRCTAALAYATRVLAAIDEAVPVAAARLRRRLAIPIAVDHHGARALLEFRDGALASAWAPRRPAGDYANARDADLVRRLLSGNGSAGRHDEPAPVILRFDRSA